MKKLFILMFCMIFLVGTVSAVEWNDKLTYSNNDLKVSLDNWWGLGKTIGTIELKSHKSVDEVLEFGFGKEEVVMYYDFVGWELYENGLGEVIFTDENTGKEIEKDYGFVEWTKIDVPNYIQTCSKKTETGLNECSTTQQGTKKVDGWKKLNSNDIPGKNARIGIKTYISEGDKIDGVWTIAGKKVERHAIWAGGLDVALSAYYKLDETAGTNAKDETNVNNATANNSIIFTTNITGIINTGADFLTADNVIVLPDVLIFTPFSVSLWVNFTVTQDNGMFGGDTNNLELRVSGSDTLIFDKTAAVGILPGNRLIQQDVLTHVILTYAADGNATTYINGTFDQSVVSLQTFTNRTQTIGAAFTGNELNGSIDEFAIWHRVLTPNEVITLYNNGEACGFFDETCGIPAPTVTLDAPSNNTNFTLTNNVVMNATIFDATNITNVTLYLNNVGNETNTTAGINNTVWTFTKNMGEGDTFWTMEACNFLNFCVNASQRVFNVNTTPNIQFGDGVPINEFNSSNNFFEVNVTLTENLFQNITFDFYNLNGALNRSVTFTNSSREKNWTNLIDSSYSYNVTTATITNQFNSTATRNITINALAPQINITRPLEIVDIHSVNTNLTINWTVSQDLIDTCILQFEGINRTVTCSDNQTEINITNIVNRSIIFFANDTLGLENSTTRSWNYRIFENQPIFTASTIGGTTETYIGNITLGSGETIASSNLSYNGSGNSVSVVGNGGNLFNLTSQFTTPTFSSDQNVSFFWRTNLNSVGELIGATFQQEIKLLSIDNCSVNTNTIFNYTMLDEGLQTNLLNTTFEIDLNIFNLERSISVVNFSSLYNNTNPSTICLNIDLTNSTVYSLDSTAKYSTLEDYEIEYYNIQNFTLKNSTVPQNINLFNLLTADSTEFQITFKDSSFVVVENALIQINRQYVSEGVFKTVEIPKTDSNGQTIGHFVEKDIVYNILVTKNGVVLGTFNNVIAFCDDATVGQCFIALNALETNLPVFDYDSEIGLSFDFTYNETSRLLEFPFSTLDGSVKNISMNGTQLDMLGNSSICGDFLVSASGTLSCTVPASVGNETIIVDIFVNGNLVLQNYISAGTEFDLGDAGFFLLFFLVLSTALMLSQSKIGVIVGTVIGFIAGLLLSFFQGGLLGTGSAIVWLVIWAMALIWKLNSERQV